MKPRITFRVNGTRLAEPARPSDATDLVAATAAAGARLPTKRLVARVNAALSTRPNEYMPDDGGEAAS